MFFYFSLGRSFFNVISFVSQSIKFTYNIPIKLTQAPFTNFQFDLDLIFKSNFTEGGGKRKERKRNGNFGYHWRKND